MFIYPIFWPLIKCLLSSNIFLKIRKIILSYKLLSWLWKLIYIYLLIIDTILRLLILLIKLSNWIQSFLEIMILKMVLLKRIWMDINICIIIIYHNYSSTACKLLRKIKCIATQSNFLSRVHKVQILNLSMLPWSNLIYIFLLINTHLWKLLIYLVAGNRSLIWSYSPMITTLSCWR
jgi:hypothetical protein